MANPLRLPMALTALKNLFSAPATRVEPRPSFPEERGQLAFDVSTCVFCGVCARRCPSTAIDVSREEKRLSIEHLRCVLCGVCVDACAKHSLSLEPGPLSVQTDGRDRHRTSFTKPAVAPQGPGEKKEPLPRVG